MATIRKRGNSYLFRCYDGVDESTGRQREFTMTWKPPAGMSEKKADREAQHEAALFEERVRTGQVCAERLKFSEFSRRWFDDYAAVQLRPRTVARYRELMDRITPAFGHLQMDRIRPAHLVNFYKELSKTAKPESYTAAINLKAAIKKTEQTQAAFAVSAGVSGATLRAALQGKNVAAKTAVQISAALGVPIEKAFKANPVKQLAGKTVLHYHRLLSSMFHTAVEWQIIPANPAERVKPPKVQAQEAKYLDDEQALHLLDLLQAQPIRYRAPVLILLYTGMRRAELLGLEWRDVDFDHGTLTISKSSLYLADRGVFEDETKNRSSNRVIPIPATALQILADFRKWQISERLRLGPLWQDSGKIFTNAVGKPLHPDTLTGWFHDFIAKTDLPPIHLHNLRHTNATLMIANGVAVTTVAGQLGHANAATTEKIYAHAIKSAAAASAQIVDDLLKPAQRQA